MPTITLTRGIPGSGKSTFAREWVQEDPDHRIRINRDDLRRTLYATTSTLLTTDQERFVSVVEKDIARDALRNGYDVVVDAMNLNPRWVKEWQKLGHPVIFRDFPISLEDAIARDDQREHRIGEDVIRRLFQRYTDKGALPATPLPVKAPVFDPYVPGDIATYSFDIDGTLALMGDRRGPYDTSKYHLDERDNAVWDIYSLLEYALDDFYGPGSRGTSWAIIGLSGRSEDHRAVTEKWLTDHDITFDALFMRPSGDTRNDAIVKSELVDQHISGVYNVIAHFDDRNRVVNALRAKGLKVVQVAPGDF
ncbi:hypothetical protein GCM10025773_12140 [Microbacterium jejuense]